MTDLDTNATGLSARAAQIADTESAVWRDRTQSSKALYERALLHLPMGVPSSFQAGDPYPVYVERGAGSHVWDVDGNEYLDFHGGFGVNLVGHAHPKIVEAITHAANTGTHFAAPTPVTVELAEELCSTPCASPTRAPRPPWTPSAWHALRPVATPWSRSKARTTGTTTR
jgi:glutamate-1-semialdehyde 2,1-aminomutase